MRGEQINHFAYDSDTQEIIEVIVLPTFADRMEAAKSAAPYFANKLQPEKHAPGTGFSDTAKQPGVMEVPLVDSMAKWTELAAQSQRLLKREVTKSTSDSTIVAPVSTLRSIVRRRGLVQATSPSCGVVL